MCKYYYFNVLLSCTKEQLKLYFLHNFLYSYECSHPTLSIEGCDLTGESVFCCFELFVFHTGSTVQLELKWLIMSTKQNTDLIPLHQLESLVWKKVIPQCFRSPPIRGREGQSRGVGAVMWMSLHILRVKSETMFLYHPCCSISNFHSCFNLIWYLRGRVFKESCKSEGIKLFGFRRYPSCPLWFSSTSFGCPSI